MKKLTRKQRFDRERHREHRASAVRVMDKMLGRQPLWGDLKTDFPNDCVEVEVDIPWNYAADMREEARKFLDMPLEDVPTRTIPGLLWTCQNIRNVKRLSPDTLTLTLVFGPPKKCGFTACQGPGTKPCASSGCLHPNAKPHHARPATVTIGGVTMTAKDWKVSNVPH